MAIGSAAFRRALSCFPTGVAVVTTLDAEGAPAGITVSSFNSVSLDPPLVLWSIDRQAACYEVFMNAPYFAVNVLSLAELSLVARFALREGDKFAGLVCRRGLGGIPVLPDFAACFECGTEHRYDGGDHTIIVGRVLAFEDHEKEPLIVHRGRYFGNGGV
ncbi:MAG TPA: flavin reductase family protein [Woeseiaceae bacterium]|nr:flavin reductase family protein [Woeseiaceae bacterium]